MKRAVVICGVVLFALMLTGCAPGGNSLANMPYQNGETAGFWFGLWHGVIAPVSLVVSLFSDRVTMYEVHNNGGWYNFGFLLGMMVVFGGSGGKAARGRRSYR